MNKYRREQIILEDGDYKVVKNWCKYSDDSPQYQIYKIEKQLGMNIANTFLPNLDIEEIALAHEIFGKLLGIKDLVDELKYKKWESFRKKIVEDDLARPLSDRNIQVTRIHTRMPLKLPDERGINLAAMSEMEVVAAEVEMTLTLEKLKKNLHNLKRFKEFFPEYKDKTIYGCVAYLSDHGNAAEEAKREGLFVIKAPSGESKVSVLTNAPDFKPREF